MVSWQNLTWLFFHKIASVHNSKNDKYYKQFFEAFKVILPCSICRNHYNKMIENNKFDIEKNINNNNLFNWTIDMHNNVNINNGKSAWSYEKARRFYKSTYITTNLTKHFLLNYAFYNYRKGSEKTKQLINMTEAFIFIFPRENIRLKLIEFNNKFNINKQKYRKWVTAVLLIIKNHMR